MERGEELMQLNRDELELNRAAAVRKRTEEIVAELQDGRAERKAQTEALLVLIDRLPPPAQAA